MENRFKYVWIKSFLELLFCCLWLMSKCTCEVPNQEYVQHGLASTNNWVLLSLFKEAHVLCSVCDYVYSTWIILDYIGQFYEAVFYSVLLIIKDVRITWNKELKVLAIERTISWASLGKDMYQASVA